MRILKFLLLVLMLTSTRMLANNLPPESVIEPIPNRSWLYTGEWAFFNGASSYDRDENGNSITNYYWHIRIGSGSYVQKSSGSSASNYHVCFELGGTAYATTSNGCIAMGSSTTATVRLKVYDDEGSYDYGYSTLTIKTPAKSRYFITDHLGNIRTTIDEDGEAMGADDYFPFGLVMPGRSNTTANANDLYKYTSHERDEEAFSDALDYMLARNYDPMIGRMNQIDPMAHVYSGISPYAYALNTPMNAIDPDGRLVIFVNGFPFDGYVRRTYWNNAGNGFFADQIMNFFPGERSAYVDGAKILKHSGEAESVSMWSFSGRFSSTLSSNLYSGSLDFDTRRRIGEMEGESIAKSVIKNLKRNDDNEIIETVKIITHSMGAAYARGMIKAMLDYMSKNPDDAFEIEFVLDIAALQGGKLSDLDGIPTFQASGKYDIIAWGRGSGSISVTGGTGHGLGSGFNPMMLLGDIFEWFEKNDSKSTVIIPGLPRITITVYD